MTEYIIINIDGKETKCPILFTFYLEEYEHNYVVFQHENTDEISAMIYEETDGTSGKLLPIESDDEWDKVEEVVNDYFEEHHHHHEGCHCESCEGDCGCESCCDECGSDE